MAPLPRPPYTVTSHQAANGDMMSTVHTPAAHTFGLIDHTIKPPFTSAQLHKMETWTKSAHAYNPGVFRIIGNDTTPWGIASNYSDMAPNWRQRDSQPTDPNQVLPRVTPPGLPDPGNLGNPANRGAGAVVSAGSALAGFFHLLTDKNLWIRVGEFLLGALAIGVGVAMISKTGRQVVYTVPMYGKAVKHLTGGKTR